MKLYGGIDLHSNNLDEKDKTVHQRRLGNDLQTILEALEGKGEFVTVPDNPKWNKP